MYLAQETIRASLVSKIKDIAANTSNADVKAACENYLNSLSEGAANAIATRELVAALEACGCEKSKDVLKLKEYLAKKSVWIFGGDGWAYDIEMCIRDRFSIPSLQSVFRPTSLRPQVWMH